MIFAGRLGFPMRHLLSALILLCVLTPSASADDEPGDERVEGTTAFPNVSWSAPASVTVCPAGDSVYSRPAQIRILVTYLGPTGSPRAGVPPESIWVRADAGGGLINDQQSYRAGDLVIYADDSTNSSGQARITIRSLSGCGALQLELYVSGTLINPTTALAVVVRSTDSDGDGDVDSDDESAPCDLNYASGVNETDAALVHSHLHHQRRNVLFGTPVKRTTLPGYPYAYMGAGGVSWSADGTRIAFSVHDPSHYYDCSVYWTYTDPVSGDALTKLSFPTTSNVHDYNVHWSPTGDKVLWDRSNRAIMIKGVPGLATDTSETVLTEHGPSDGIGDTDPAVSPDGTMLAFVRYDYVADAQNIFVMPIAGGTPTQLTTDVGYNNNNPQWSLDGQYLFYRKDVSGGGGGVYKVPVAGGSEVAIYVPSSNGQASLPAETRDGLMLLASLRPNVSTPSKIITIDPYIGAASVVENYSAFESSIGMCPRQSPDGTRTGFLNSQIWSVRRNMSLPPVISSVGGHSVTHAVPTIDLSVLETQPLSATVSATDPESDPITYDAHSAATGLGYSINATTGAFTWTPDRAKGGYTYSIRLQAETPSGGCDYAIARVAVSDTTRPGQVTYWDIDLLSDTEIWPFWTASGEDGSYGQCVEYDLRRSTSLINGENFGSATEVGGEPTPSVAGHNDEKGITGLSPSTNYWIALKSRDAAGNWSPISAVLSATTLSSGGGGGFAREQGRPGVLSRLRSASLQENAGASAAELMLGDSVATWSVYPIDDTAAAGIFGEDSATIIVQRRDSTGAWVQDRRMLTNPASSRFALRGLRNSGRYVFRAPNTFQQAWPQVVSRNPGEHYQLSAAHHSGAGDVTAAMDSAGIIMETLGSGDTLTLTYRRASGDSESASDWFMVIGSEGIDAVTHSRVINTVNTAAPGLRNELGTNRPNPFVDHTVLGFSVLDPTHVRIEVFDLLGRRVASLIDRDYAAGEHSVNWSGLGDHGEELRSGVYLCRMTAGKFHANRRIVIMR